MRRNRASKVAMVLVLAGVPALAKDFYIYAQKGQSAEQQHRQQQARSSASAARSNFNRAYTACMEGRGYTVK
jgi:Tfp pilus assembly protein PilV